MKRWPRVVSPAAMPSTEKGTTSGSSVSGPKVHRIEWSGRTQRSGSGAAELAPQRIDFGHGKLLTMPGSTAAMHLGGRGAGPLDHRGVEIALLGIVRHRRLVDRVEARALQKALQRALWRADARPLALLARVGLAGRQADHMQRQPPRRRKTLGALIGEAALDQRAGDEPLQIGGRLGLHAGRDFFGEQFEQEFGHGSASDKAAPS